MHLAIKKWFTPFAAMLLVAGIILTGCSSTTPPSPVTPVTPTTPAPVTPPAISPTTAPPTTTPATSGAPVFMSAQLTDLNGAGATFPYPLYSKWFDEYNKITGTKINYQSIGSGGGISQITAGTVDFGASDGIMTDAQIATASAAYGPVLAIPMTSDAVAVIYNITTTSGNVSGLKLTPDVLADIYLKKIINWSDARITSLNPGLKIPYAPIAVVHRSDGSGTTNIFTNYLSKVSDEWKTRVGNANSVNWPGDVGGSGNAGVAGQVQQIPGAIGYVGVAYALQNNLPYATLKNAAGNFISPSLASAAKASEGVTLPDDMKIMLTNSANPDAYPIVGFTWMLVHVNQTDKAKGVSLVKMLWWAIHDGQNYTTALTYVPLSSAAVAKAENEILSIKYGGQPIVTR